MTKRAHSKSEYKRLKTLGADVLPPEEGPRLGQKAFVAFTNYINPMIKYPLDEWKRQDAEVQDAWNAAAQAVGKAERARIAERLQKAKRTLSDQVGMTEMAQGYIDPRLWKGVEFLSMLITELEGDEQ